LNAVQTAKSLGIFSVLFVGTLEALDEGDLKVNADMMIESGTNVTSHAQEVHLVIGHTLANIVEKDLFLDGGE
jgi:phosphoheptose isomerase